jgi:hypothetical protein
LFTDNVWNGHYACTCYHPLFLFNQFGDLERCALRPGNVHSADGWDGVLKPVVARYNDSVSRLYFRADAGFASPDIYEYLEGERIKYVIRLPANRILHERIAHLLTRPMGRPPNEVRRGRHRLRQQREGFDCRAFEPSRREDCVQMREEKRRRARWDAANPAKSGKERLTASAANQSGRKREQSMLVRRSSGESQLLRLGRRVTISLRRKEPKMHPRGWRRAPHLVVALALTLLANFYLGETPLGWALALLGVGFFIYGSAGLCPACALRGCRVEPRKPSGG